MEVLRRHNDGQYRGPNRYIAGRIPSRLLNANEAGQDDQTSTAVKFPVIQFEGRTSGETTPGNVTTSWIRSAASINVSCVRCAYRCVVRACRCPRRPCTT